MVTLHLVKFGPHGLSVFFFFFFGGGNPVFHYICKMYSFEHLKKFLNILETKLLSNIYIVFVYALPFFIFINLYRYYCIIIIIFDNHNASYMYVSVLGPRWKSANAKICNDK